MCTVEQSKQSVIITCHSDTYQDYFDYVRKVFFFPNKLVGFPLESSIKAFPMESSIKGLSDGEGGESSNVVKI